MGTTTPATESERESETAGGSAAHPRRGTAATGGRVQWDSPHPTRTTPETGRPDRRADSTGDAPDRHSRAVPLTFDSSSTRRVRNRIDEANAALPDAR